MSFIYVVGPSGAGKSKLCEMLVSSDKRYQHVDLDKEVKRIAPDFTVMTVSDWEVRWEYCLQALRELSGGDDSDIVYLVDSGAGALMSTDGQEYFVEHAARLICIDGDPKIIYARNADKFRKKGKLPRPFEDFFRDEYSPQRNRVYQAAKAVIDTGLLSESDALVHFRETVDLLENQSDR